MGFLWMWMLLLNWSMRSLWRSRKRTKNDGNIAIITDGGMMMRSGHVNIDITEGMKSENGENGENGHTVHIREESGMLIRKEGPTGGARWNGMVHTTEIEGGSQIMEETGTEALGTITENGEIATDENEVHTTEKKAGNGVREVDQDKLNQAFTHMDGKWDTLPLSILHIYTPSYSERFARILPLRRRYDSCGVHLAKNARQ